MTLIEVSIGMFLFLTLAAGLAGSLLSSRKMAAAALYESSALVAAEGYMEQMKTIAFSTLYECRKDAASPANIPTVTGSGGSDPLAPSTSLSDDAANWNTRVIDIYGHYSQESPPSGATDVMPMKFAVMITNLSAGTNDDRILIQLKYSWDLPAATGAARTREGFLALIRSSVKAYVN